jgi:hypothetical protein
MKKILSCTFAALALLVFAHAAFAAPSVTDEKKTFLSNSAAVSAQGQNYGSFKIKEPNTTNPEKGTATIYGNGTSHIGSDKIDLLLKIAGTTSVGALDFKLVFGEKGGAQTSYNLPKTSLAGYTFGQEPVQYFHVSVSGLDPVTEYQFKLTEGTTKSESSVTTFKTLTAAGINIPTAFTIHYAGQEAGENAGEYNATFDVTPDAALSSPLSLSVRVFGPAATPNANAGMTEFTAPAGSLTTSPVVEGLSPGSYTAAVYSNATKISQTITFSITASQAPSGIFLELQSEGQTSVGNDLYKELFSVTPTSPLTKDVQVEVSYDQLSGGGSNTSDTFTETISAGSSGFSFETKGLPEGQYEAVVFSNNTPASNSITFSIVGNKEDGILGTEKFSVSLDEAQKSIGNGQYSISLKVTPKNPYVIGQTYRFYDADTAGTFANDGQYVEFVAKTGGQAFVLEPLVPGNWKAAVIDGSTVISNIFKFTITDTPSPADTTSACHDAVACITDGLEGKTGAGIVALSGLLLTCTSSMNATEKAAFTDLGSCLKSHCTSITFGSGDGDNEYEDVAQCVSAETGPNGSCESQYNACLGVGSTVIVSDEDKDKLPNFIKWKSIPEAVAAIMDNLVIPIAVPGVILAIIYTGFLFVTARGNSKKIEEAQKAALYTAIGSAIILGAWVIASAISGTINAIRGTASIDKTSFHA